MDYYITVIIVQIITLIVAGAAGFLCGISRKTLTRLNAFERGMKASLRRDLVDSYERYVQEGQVLTIERKHEIVDAYEAYSALGGNGTGKQMYEAICDVEVTVV